MKMLSPNETRLLTEKYKGLEYLNLPIALADNSFSLLYFNSTFSRLFQQSAEVFPVRDFSGMFDTFSEKIDILKKAGLSAGYLQNFVIPSVKLHSAERYFDLHVSKFSPELDHLEGFSVTCVEVTEREKEISNLQESSEQHTKFLLHTTSGVIIHQDDFIKYVNQQGNILLGAKENETIIGESIWNIISAESKDIVKQRIKKLASEGGVALPIEEKFIKLDGSVIDVEVFSYPAAYKGMLAVISIFTDISERKKAAKKIADSQKQYQSLVHNLKDVIFQVDDEGKFIFLNKSWYDLTGFTVEETIGASCFDFIDEKTNTDIFYRRLRKLIATAGQSMEFECLVKTKSGDPKYVELKFQVQYNSDKSIRSVNGVAADIHSKKLAQLELKTIEETLKKHNKILLSLAKNDAIYRGNFSEALQEIVKMSAETLNTSRASIWQFAEDYKKLDCLTAYDIDNKEFIDSEKLSIENCTKYFQYLLNDRILDVSNCLRDHRFSELKDSYCIPEEINASLDVSVIMEDNVWGVICFEQKFNPRVWTLEDQSFARSIAEFISLAYQANKRKQIQSEVNKKEELYKTLIEQADDAIYIINANGKFLELNHGTSKLTGYTKEELLELDIKQLFPKRFIQRGVDVLQEVRIAKQFNKERILVKKNGAEITTEISSVVLPDGRIQGIARDITERKNHEKVLKESETRLDLALKGADLGTWDFFIQEDRIFHNKRWGEILGYNFEMNVMNEHFVDKFVHPDDVKFIYDEFQKHLRGETPYYNVTVRMLASNGEYKWIEDKGKVVEWDENGNPVRASGIHHDVTALKMFEKEIQMQKTNLQQMINAIPNPMYVKNANEEIVVVNKALADFLGTTEQKLLQYKSLQKESFYVNLNFLFESDSEVFISRKPVIIPEQQITDDEKNVKWVQSIKIPLQDSEGNFSEILSVFTDITELKVKEQELAELNENLEQKAADRTAMLEIANKELETFNYSVSHDLRTPLRTIDIFAYFLEKNYKDKLDKEASDNIKQIRQSIIKMSTLIDNLVVYSKMGRQELKLIEVNTEEIIKEVIAEISKEDESLNVQYNITHLPHIYADRSMLKEAIYNLVNNAVKFTRTRTTPVIEFFGYVDETATTISIRDNGVGFSMEYKDKLFKAFKRLHSEEHFEGTGVGLAIVEKIVKRHNGQVWADSEENKGTTFYIKLPNK
ncbi:MAG: PAS domain S-box protein [Fimbriimonadaceae bacterium]|nr:PAS domain S-box protein [Chitinophagales bacterium]